METKIVQDTVKELIDPPPNAVHKAVDEVVLTLLFHHELLPTISKSRKSITAL